jgi:Tripartite ATP-independent periplasmic transporter, DctM component
MTAEAQAFIVFSAGMLLLMGIGLNMAFALVLTGAGMAWVLDFWDTQLLAQNLVAGVDSFPLLAVPFFILAGELMNSGGISRRIIDMAQAWVGHIRGGLGFVAIGAAVLMASIGRHRCVGHHFVAHDEASGLPYAHLGRLDCIGRHHCPHHSAIHAFCDLWRDHQHLHLFFVFVWHRAWTDHGHWFDRGVEASTASH